MYGSQCHLFSFFNYNFLLPVIWTVISWGNPGEICTAGYSPAKLSAKMNKSAAFTKYSKEKQRSTVNSNEQSQIGNCHHWKWALWQRSVYRNQPADGDISIFFRHMFNRRYRLGFDPESHFSDKDVAVCLQNSFSCAMTFEHRTSKALFTNRLLEGREILIIKLKGFYWSGWDRLEIDSVKLKNCSNNI